MKRSVIFLMILIFTGATKVFCENTTLIKDSLLKVLETLPADTTRLETLFLLSRLEPMAPSYLQYMDQIMEESTRQGNEIYRCRAMYAYITYYFNHQDAENLTLWMNRLEEPALKNKLYYIYFKSKRAEITMHIIKHKIEYSITEAENMYELAKNVNFASGMSSAKLCLMAAYLMTMRNKEGIKAGLEAYRLLPADTPLKIRKEVLQEIVLACSSTQDENLLIFLNEYRDVLDRLFSSQSTSSSKKNAYLLLESLSADYYINENKLAEAHKYIQEMDKHFFPKSYIPCRGLYYDVYSRYYKLTHEYDKAIACADSAINLLSNLSENGGLNYEINRASILADAGRFDEAIPLFQKSLTKKNAFYRDLSASQTDEIYQMLNIDKLILEKEKHQTIIHYISILLIIITLVILIPSTIRIYHIRKRLKKEEEESRAMSLIAEEANEVKNRFLANVSYNIRIPLNSVLGFSNLMATEPENIDAEQWNAYTQIIQTNSAELIQLVTDVLDLSRLEAGKTKWQISDCEIIQLCSDIIGMVHMKCNDKIQINFSTEIESLLIQTDSARFTQVILSTLSYTEPWEEKRIVYFSLGRDDEQKQLIFHIVNSPLADTKQQTHKKEIRHNINRLIIEHFGGTYTIEPETPEGAALTFTYPYIRIF